MGSNSPQDKIQKDQSKVEEQQEQQPVLPPKEDQPKSDSGRIRGISETSIQLPQRTLLNRDELEQPDKETSKKASDSAKDKPSSPEEKRSHPEPLKEKQDDGGTPEVNTALIKGASLPPENLASASATLFDKIVKESAEKIGDALIDEAAEKVMAELEDEPWYHGALPIEDIAAMVTSKGDFLIRELEPEEGRGPMVRSVAVNMFRPRAL